MHRILIIAKDLEKIRGLKKELDREGFNGLVTEDAGDVLDDTAQKGVDLALVDLDSSPDSILTEFNWNQLREIKQGKQLPVIVLISQTMIHDIESATDIDDFVIEPCNLTELIARIKRLLKKASNLNSEEVISCGDLVIDTAKCEVYLESRLLYLTFKEYELLRFLATNKGRVFSREALLNEVWGYDYYGGDRTVDVHVRRLRSKVEDSNHTFIDTVRSIGYIFRECNWSPSLDTNNISNRDTAMSDMPNS